MSDLQTDTAAGSMGCYFHVDIQQLGMHEYVYLMSSFVESKYGEAGRGEEGEGEWREKGEGESEWINEAHTYRVLHPSHSPHGPPVHSFREVSWAEPWCIECGDVELVDWVPGIVHTLRGMCKLFWCLKK